EKGEPGQAYNVGTGKAISIRELGDILASLAKVKVEFKVDPTRLRPSDVTLLVADTSKFRKQTGWEPTIPFKKTAEDLLNYWRERV
ncbi:MAG: GDP-mannose 4,6 dehydratase, partial [Dehalococcoidia bacterium]|nr:GDP-mannose 4,6 dehydratase [Dehalococcoidia bacterium]